MNGSLVFSKLSWPYEGISSLVLTCQPRPWLNRDSFQKIQELSPVEASLRFIPEVAVGIVLSIVTGHIVHRFRADYLVVVLTTMSAGGPLLIAIADPSWSYWYCEFWAVSLLTLSVDGKSNDHPGYLMPCLSTWCRYDLLCDA